MKHIAIAIMLSASQSFGADVDSAPTAPSERDDLDVWELVAPIMLMRQRCQNFCEPAPERFPIPRGCVVHEYVDNYKAVAQPETLTFNAYSDHGPEHGWSGGRTVCAFISSTGFWGCSYRFQVPAGGIPYTWTFAERGVELRSGCVVNFAEGEL